MIDASEVDDLAGDLAREAEAVKARIERALGKATDFLYHLSRATVPRDSGALYASIRKDDTGMSRRVYATDEAAVFQEFGTSSHGPQPFLMVHANSAARRLEREMADESWGG